MAGMNALEKIIKSAPEAFEITVFGKERHPNYNRIMLSSVLQGEADMNDISIHPRSWYKRNRITLYTGETVIEINKEKQQVTTDKGTVAAYDKLIIATGSNPFILPIPGADKDGVVAFRTLDDCEYMIKAAETKKTAVVIGGGLLGLEAARGLLTLGMDVYVVHRSHYLMNKQLDHKAAALLQQELSEKGMNFLLNKETVEISGGDQAECVYFQDGSSIDTDLVVMSAGIVPNTELAKESGIETNRGIVVNDVMETSAPNVFSVGECAEHQGITYGLVKPLYEQADILAGYITGTSSRTYEGSLTHARLKISGIDVFSIGRLEASETTEVLEIHDETEKLYKKVILQDEIIVGAILYGDVEQESTLLSLVSKQKPMSDEEKHAILFAAGQEESIVKTLPHTSHVCNCNNVSKGEVIQSVVDNNLMTSDQVKEFTGASSSCGGCKPLVKELLSYIQSNEFDDIPKKTTICTCTDKTEQEVVYAIQEKNLRTVEDVITVLQWQNKQGCNNCIPALQYYLTMIYPHYKRNQETFTLEDDGTYTFSLQHYGGITAPDELLNIAEAAKKLNVPSIRLMPNQRMQLAGIKKEMLPDIREAFHVENVSTLVYRLESVQVYPSRGNCACSKSTAQHLAINFEKQCIHLQTPWFVDMRITTCARDCVEVRKADIGLLGIKNGWEIYVAAGRTQERNELLYVTRTKEEAIDMVKAIFQYYREGAEFKESIGDWAKRVTFIHLREVLFDTETMQLLLQRLEDHVSNVGAASVAT